MGMRRHAMVLLLPATGRQHARRHVAAMQRAVCEYVAMAQRMQPPLARGGAADASAVEATRLLLSLNVLLPVGNGGDVEMARAVAVSGQANQVPRQIAQMLEVQVKKWTRLVGAGHRGACISDDTTEDALSRCGAVMRLLADLAAQQFVVSVLTPADALRFGASDRLAETLQNQVKIQFVLLRDEDEQSDIAAQNVLELLRGIKASSNRNCAIRQVEECEIEMEGIVKEWLHAAAPKVCSTMQLGSDERALALELEIRANFVLVQASEAPGSSWMALRGDLNKLQLLHFVPLKSVHPAVLLGCPLRATPIGNSLSRGRALGRYLRDEGHGGLVVCRMKNGVRGFYLLVGSPDSAIELLMHQVASAEEVLLPDCGEASSEGSESESQTDDRELETIRKLLIRDFNPFSNRSGILDAKTTEMKDSKPGDQVRARRADGDSPVRGTDFRGSTTTKKKRRL